MNHYFKNTITGEHLAFRLNGLPYNKLADHFVRVKSTKQLRESAKRNIIVPLYSPLATGNLARF